MELVIDEGNTLAKAAIFINNGIHKILRADSADEELRDMLLDFKPEQIIISSVRGGDEKRFTIWTELAPTLVFDQYTPVPVINKYRTPETLGRDRIAGVIGARFLQPEGNLLVIDAGTCITFDLLTDENHYLGGRISPGAAMRFKALHHFTGALPEVDGFNSETLFGNDTLSSIASGVMNGYRDEVNAAIDEFSLQFSPLFIGLCGGEARYLVNHIKKEIFANQNLVLLGLHKILKFNEKV